MLHKSLVKYSKLLGMPSLLVQILLACKAEFKPLFFWKPPLIAPHTQWYPFTCTATYSQDIQDILQLVFCPHYMPHFHETTSKVLAYHLAFGSHWINSCGLNRWVNHSHDTHNFLLRSRLHHWPTIPSHTASVSLWAEKGLCYDKHQAYIFTWKICSVNGRFINKNSKAKS